MVKKKRTQAQIEADKARMAKVRSNRKKNVVIPPPGETPKEPDIQPPVTDKQDRPDFTAMQKQLDEVMETNLLLKAAILNNNGGVEIGQGNKIVGETDKYLIDPEAYPDPTKRLSQEPRLQSIAFNHNYELSYEFKVRPYETKTGLNMREPEFIVTLLRVSLDDQGNRIQVENPQTRKKEDKFYIARRLMFHEDPQAALVIARDNNIQLDTSDEKTFLDEMRYLRVRDWLFDVLWPKQSDEQSKIQEEVVGGTIVQVFTKASVEPSAVEFDQLDKKVV